MRRSQRRRLDSRIAAETREGNRGRKQKERVRRDARMLERLKAGGPPYTPDLMSWLSAKLGKPSRNITPEDIAKFKS